ncbi:hypothetical protein ES703_67094 [subsurface metagenome]
MITIYFLPVVSANNTDTVAGVDLMHDGILEATEDPLTRKLIMNTTAQEDALLTPLAIETRYPTPDEVEQYLSQVVIVPPDPDTVRAEELLATSPQVITQPDIWELLRIYGRRHGYRF